MTDIGHSAIIDIGSNSVRLVVYNGPRRAPAVLFNEKVMAGLGAGLANSGKLAPSSMRRALAALRRYHALVVQMGVTHLRVVATAAAREASNAQQFLDQIALLGLPVEVLSGDEEAVAAGYGVLSAIPDAEGIVGDLGGGSLELIRVHGGAVHERTSLPLGVLRLREIIARGPAALDKHVTAVLREAGWDNVVAELPLYLVGGSWRTLARFHMRVTDYPLPVIHHYPMPPSACRTIITNLEKVGPQQAKAVAAISASRLPTLGDSAKILAVVAAKLRSSQLIVSAHGLREGLLFQTLTEDQQREHPLLAAARAEGSREGRFAEHGDELNAWIAPLFRDEPPEMERLRHAACLLGDISWRVNPDFRAERGLDTALHGNWVGIDATGRAMLAQALYTAFGGGQSSPPILAKLASPALRAQATRWGLAMRLGQRLSGGLAYPLQHTALAYDGASVILKVALSETGYLGDAVERRHKNLAAAFGAAISVESI